MKTVHNNEDYVSSGHVYSDEKYDYAIVNGESVSRYYGSKGGEYESYPIHTLMNPVPVILNNPWILQVLRRDKGRLYKHFDELNHKVHEIVSKSMVAFVSNLTVENFQEHLDIHKKNTEELEDLLLSLDRIKTRIDLIQGANNGN